MVTKAKEPAQNSTANANGGEEVPKPLVIGRFNRRGQFKPTLGSNAPAAAKTYFVDSTGDYIPTNEIRDGYFNWCGQFVRGEPQSSPNSTNLRHTAVSTKAKKQRAEKAKGLARSRERHKDNVLLGRYDEKGFVPFSDRDNTLPAKAEVGILDAAGDFVPCNEIALGTFNQDGIFQYTNQAEDGPSQPVGNPKQGNTHLPLAKESIESAFTTDDEVEAKAFFRIWCERDIEAPSKHLLEKIKGVDDSRTSDPNIDLSFLNRPLCRCIIENANPASLKLILQACDKDLKLDLVDLIIDKPNQSSMLTNEAFVRRLGDDYRIDKLLLKKISDEIDQHNPNLAFLYQANYRAALRDTWPQADRNTRLSMLQSCVLVPDFRMLPLIFGKDYQQSEVSFDLLKCEDFIQDLTSREDNVALIRFLVELEGDLSVSGAKKSVIHDHLLTYGIKRCRENPDDLSPTFYAYMIKTLISEPFSKQCYRWIQDPDVMTACYFRYLWGRQWQNCSEVKRLSFAILATPTLIVGYLTFTVFVQTIAAAVIFPGYLTHNLFAMLTCHQCIESAWPSWPANSIGELSVIFTAMLTLTLITAKVLPVLIALPISPGIPVIGIALLGIISITKAALMLYQQLEASQCESEVLNAMFDNPATFFGVSHTTREDEGYEEEKHGSLAPSNPKGVYS